MIHIVNMIKIKKILRKYKNLNSIDIAYVKNEGYYLDIEYNLKSYKHETNFTKKFVRNLLHNYKIFHIEICYKC